MIDYLDKSLFASPSTHYAWSITATNGTSTVTITNDELRDEGLALYEQLCSESELRFGECEASELEFVIESGAVNGSLVGWDLTVTVTPSGSDDALEVGHYKVVKDELTADRELRQITAYDALYTMHNTDVTEWYGSLFPNNESEITLGTLRRKLEEKFGVENEYEKYAYVKQSVDKTKVYKRSSVIANVPLSGQAGNIDVTTGAIIAGGVGTYAAISGVYVQSRPYKITFTQDINQARVFFYKETVSQVTSYNLLSYTTVYADDPYFKKPSNCDYMRIWINSGSLNGTMLDIVSIGYYAVLPLGSEIYAGESLGGQQHYIISADGDDFETTADATLYYVNSSGTWNGISVNASESATCLNAEDLPYVVSGYGSVDDVYTSTNDNVPNDALDNLNGAIVLNIYGVENPRDIQLIYVGEFETRKEVFRIVPEVIYPYGMTYINRDENVNVNDTEAVRKGFEGSISAGTLLKAYCELNGVFGHIGRDGKMDYITLKSSEGLRPHAGLYPHEGLYPSSGSNPKEVLRFNYESGSLDYASYKTMSVSQLQIRATSDDVGVIVGTGGNNYVIESNPLTYTMGVEQLQRVATNILSVISQASYVPYSVTTIGNPCIEVGDTVQMWHSEGGVEGYVLHRTLRGIQALTDEYGADGVERYPDNVNGLNYELKRIAGKFLEVKKDIDALSLVIGDVDQNLIHQIQITAQGLDEEISRATGAEFQLQTSVEGLNLQVNDPNDGLAHSVSVTASALSSEISRATGAEFQLQTSVEGLNLQVNDPTDGLAHNVSITASALSSEISRATGAESSLSSSISQTASTLQGEIDTKTNSSDVNALISASVTESSGAINQALSLKTSESDVETIISQEVTQSGGSIKIALDGKVSDGAIISGLNSEFYSGITLSNSGIDISSNGALTIDTNGLKLDSSGNAKFSGDVYADLLANGQAYNSHYPIKIESGELLSESLYSSSASEHRHLSLKGGKLTYTDTDLTDSITYDTIELGDIGGYSAIKVSDYNSNEVEISSNGITINNSPVITAANWSRYIPNGNGVSY